jgi:hypothetical protein
MEKNAEITYDILILDETCYVSKDEKKGAKEAKKALKKLASLTTPKVEELEDKIYIKSSNRAYISAYVDVCRQAKAQIEFCA